MKIIDVPDGEKLLDTWQLKEPLSTEDALALAAELRAEALKARGRSRRTFTLPLLDGTRVLMEGWWPCEAESFDHMLRLLDAMRPGLVEQDSS